jgi:DNA polymerase delta subunit 1
LLQGGHSVLFHVTDFLHYFYIAAPLNFQKSDCGPFQTYLEAQCQKAFNQYSAVINSVQMTMKENILMFQGNQKSPYLRITVNDHKMINRVRKFVQDVNANWKGLWGNISPEDGLLTFDNIQYVQRFMVDTSVSCC